MKKIVFNISDISSLEKEKIVSDLEAASIAFRERNKISVSIAELASKQPRHLLSYFYKQLDYYRSISKKIKKSFYKII
ncbi:MAG: DNA polymerase III subunit theta [Wigglesworthia glossinidia]|nr:DNA polymerase III subunit theta [Wigglesworthia glossinidia]